MQGKCHGWELQTASEGRSGVKPRDGGLLRYKGWQSHACLDACRIKPLLREKMLTHRNAGEWRSSCRLPAAGGKGCAGSCSAQPMQQKLTSVHAVVCRNSPKRLHPDYSHTMGCRRTFSCERDVLQERCFVGGAADIATICAQNYQWCVLQMLKPELLEGIWGGCFSCPFPSRTSWLGCYN